MRVFIPVDGGKDCREAIRFIASKKEWFQQDKPEVELVYVQKPVIDSSSERGEINLKFFYEVNAQKLWATLAPEIEAFAIPVKKTSLTGHPAHIIPEYANEQKADLIVMGARG